MREQMKKVLVVGAGFAGAVVARELAENGFNVLVVDKRDHVAGNAYDYVNEHGIRVHKYGPHLWHHSNDKVQEWVSRFTEWVDYKHVVKAQLTTGEYVPLPINVETVSKTFGWAPWVAEIFLKEMADKPVSEAKNSRDVVENFVGKELCDIFFAPYTKKMWNLELHELPAGVASRIPTKTDYDPYYFPKDKYQGLPKDGYTAMFNRIFDHENITVLLSTSREDIVTPREGADSVVMKNGDEIKIGDPAQFHAIFTSEPIDMYFNCDMGELPWRSIKFHTKNIAMPLVLPAATVNFTHDGSFTRVTEWKQLPGHGVNPYMTTLTFEEPCDYRDNNMERYYPVKTSSEVDPNRELYKKYKARADEAGIHIIGRCGTFCYTDMGPCVSSTLATVRKFLAVN
jgi:UDP-galactopyranose mutase